MRTDGELQAPPRTVRLQEVPRPPFAAFIVATRHQGGVRAGVWKVHNTTTTTTTATTTGTTILLLVLLLLLLLLLLPRLMPLL